MLNVVGADLRVSIPAAGALVTAYAPGLGIGEPIDRADGWNLVAGVSLHRPRSVPPYVPDITARFARSRGCRVATPSFFAPCFGDERNRYDAGLSRSPISTETRIEAS